MTTRTATLQDAETFGVGSGEFEYIQKILGRSPNLLELELFSILWAEHASYKHSLKHLQELPRSGQRSEERRVGKECRSRRAPCLSEKKGSSTCRHAHHGAR